MTNENKPKHTPEILKVETISGAAFGFQPDAIDSVVNLKITARAETVESVRTMIAAAPELLEALKMQEAANDERSMTIHYQEQEEGAKTHEQKKYAHDNYLESATKADTLQDKATELRRIAIAKAEGR